MRSRHRTGSFGALFSFHPMSGRIAGHLSAKGKSDIILYRNGPAGKEGVIKHQQSVIRLAFGGVWSFLRPKSRLSGNPWQGRVSEPAPVILLHLIPINFSVSGFGQGVHEDDVFRLFISGYPGCHKLDKLFGLQ